MQLGLGIEFKLIQICTLLAHSFLTTPLFSAKCPAGSYNDGDMNECEVCPDNHISPEEGAALCTPCEAGKGPNSERTACGKNSCKVVKIWQG